MSILAAALLLAACASAPPPEGSAERDCFRANTVNSFDMIDRNHVRIRVGVSRHYVLTTMWNANDLDWSQRIAIRSTNGWICTGNGLGIELIGGRPRRTYPIVGIERAPEAPPEEPAPAQAS
jgi:hypothetical protein